MHHLSFREFLDFAHDLQSQTVDMDRLTKARDESCRRGYGQLYALIGWVMERRAAGDSLGAHERTVKQWAGPWAQWVPADGTVVGTYLTRVGMIGRGGVWGCHENMPMTFLLMHVPATDVPGDSVGMSGRSIAQWAGPWVQCIPFNFSSYHHADEDTRLEFNCRVYGLPWGCSKDVPLYYSDKYLPRKDNG